jgi:hypothetical protein
MPTRKKSKKAGILIFEIGNVEAWSGGLLRWCDLQWRGHRRLPCSPPDGVLGPPLPLAALRQVCHPALEAAMEQQPPVLVCHRHVSSGIASTQESVLRRLPGLAGGAGTSATGASTRVEACGDIFLALPGGITIADISITHPLAINTRDNGRRGSCPSGETEVHFVLRSGAEWLSLCAVLCRELWAHRPAGDEGLTCTGRRSGRPWRGHASVLCCRRTAGDQRWSV